MNSQLANKHCTATSKPRDIYDITNIVSLVDYHHNSNKSKLADTSSWRTQCLIEVPSSKKLQQIDIPSGEESEEEQTDDEVYEERHQRIFERLQREQVEIIFKISKNKKSKGR